MSDKRWAAIGLAVIAAACLGYGSFSRQWLVNGSRYETYGFGLRTNYTCGSSFGETPCDESTNAEYIDRLNSFGESAAKNASGAFAPMGWATFVELLIAAGALLIAAGLAIANKKPQLPVSPSSLALLAIMAALITGCVFVATKPGVAGFVGVGMSFWVFGAGAVLGIAGAQLLAKVNRPADPDLMADAMNPDQF